MQRYIVGRTIRGRSEPIAVEAEDALAAAMKAKLQVPEVMITCVRKRNKRGDRRHSHQEVTGCSD